MTVKEFLNQAACLDRLIDVKLEELARLKEISCGVSGIVTVSDGGTIQSKVEKTVEKICLLEEEINKRIDGYVDLKAEIHKMINSVPDLQQKLILEQHYLLFKTWEEIADISYMSLRNVHYIHKKAISRLETLYGAALEKLPCGESCA